MTYTDFSDITEKECEKCFCCSVCSKECQCQEDSVNAEGILKILGVNLPVNYHDIQNYVNQKIEENSDEKSDDPSEETSSEESSSSDEAD